MAIDESEGVSEVDREAQYDVIVTGSRWNWFLLPLTVIGNAVSLWDGDVSRWRVELRDKSGTRLGDVGVVRGLQEAKQFRDTVAERSLELSADALLDRYSGS